MSRVTTSDVARLLDSDKDIQPFIDTASLVVDEELVGVGLSDARLKQIEMYLAAHYLAIATDNARLLYKKVGQGAEKYAGAAPEEGDGLASTRFGQQAIALDTTGTLARMANTKVKKALFRVL